MSKHHVSSFAKLLQVFSALQIGSLLNSQGHYKDLHSARVQAQKELNRLSLIGQLTKCGGFYRLPTCQSDFSEHARLLTDHLVEILKLNIPAAIFREHTLTSIGLRPDALVLLQKGAEGLCFVLEVVHNETEQYLKSKIDAWRYWENATIYLSRLFGFKIPHFLFVVAGDLEIEGTVKFEHLIQEVKSYAQTHSLQKQKA
jgi:hypothetical protein